jgi:hypothetical protein
LLVGPGKLSVQKGDLKEAEGIDEVVKGGRLLGVDVPVGLITGCTNKVEVAHESRRARESDEGIRKGV